MKILFPNYVASAALATDLVNTSDQVRSAGDALAEPGALAQFLSEHGLSEHDLDGSGPGPGPVTADDLAAVHALRTELRGLLEAEDEERIAEGASALVARAGVGPVLRRDAEGRWQWYVETASGASLADELGAMAGTGLLGVLRALGHGRFRGCASPECEGVFVDTSKAGRRRYCMPELCGNRLNVANYRARTRA